MISRLGVQWRDTASAPKPLRTLDPSRTTFYLTHSVFLNHSIDAPSRTHPSKPVSLKMLILSSKCICCFVLEPVCIIPDVSQFMQSFVSLLDHLLQPLFFFFLSSPCTFLILSLDNTKFREKTLMSVPPLHPVGCLLQSLQNGKRCVFCPGTGTGHWHVIEITSIFNRRSFGSEKN